MAEGYSGSETILVVDDEPALSAMLEDLLCFHGYKFLQANSAEQALKILQSNHIDMVISDVTMPGMDGFELSQQIGQQYPDIKVQLVSGYSEKTQTDQVLHKKVLYKPFHSNEILERIRNLLDH